MNKVLAIALVMMSSQMSFAKDGYEVGNCQVTAQKAARAFEKINHFQLGSLMHLQGLPDQVEVYQDEEGYLKVITNTGRGENTCIVETVKFNPEP